ncbi:hypothetical protein [Rhizobacter sp. LjRoot28]|uniref:hypothetical protein n=1 Tax=Rhizobacter sp. LjRoot28 TaxID=3342309 RepID=UPI003F5096E2
MAHLRCARPSLPRPNSGAAPPGAVLAMLLVCAGISDAAHAERIYRCGPRGSEYSQTPCKGEHPQFFEVDDGRDAEQLAEAQGVAARAQAAAARLTPPGASTPGSVPARAGSLSGPFGRVRVPFEGLEIERPGRCDKRKRPRTDACR